MSSTLHLYILSLAFACASFASAQNILVGGDFESPAIPNGATYSLEVTPFGWTGTGDFAIQGYGLAGSVPSGNGAQWFDLNPNRSAGVGISQDIILNAGTTYGFSFLYNGGGGGTTTQISYSIKANTVTTLSGSVSTANLDVYHGTSWNIFSTTFTATVDGNETLSFLPNGSYSGGFIDQVQLYPVPEPSIVWLVTIGAALTLPFYRAGKRRNDKRSASKAGTSIILGTIAAV